MTRLRHACWLHFVAAVAVFQFSDCVRQSYAGEESPVTKLMFSGHSLLDNPLPDWVERIVRSKGGNLEWQQQIVIGSPVRVRTWGDGNWSGYHDGKNRWGEKLDIIKELRQPEDARPYDILVLAESHSVVGAIIWENAIGYLRHFHDQLAAGNARGQTFYYHAWLDIDKADPTAWLEHETNAAMVWDCAAARVNLSLREESRPAAISVLPAGAALVELVRRILSNEVAGLEGSSRQQLDRIFSDNVHLTEAGVYFLAALHYGVIFGRSPEGAASPPGVAPQLAASLQEIAWEVAQRHRARSGEPAPDMEACRREIATNVCQSYWEMKARPGEIRNCRSYFSRSRPEPAGNPFIWPDPTWKALPAPAVH